MSEGGRFLARWSRLKKAAATAPTADVPAAVPDAESLLANLTADSDFGVFLREEISETVRRQAMKTLFADPHFNVMDGLDIYIDDYSISEAIPAEMMATLNQARTLFAQVDEENPATPSASTDCDNLTETGQNVPPAPSCETPSTENQ